jgi:hypothetical protein
MSDGLFLTLMVAFALLTWAFVALCDRLLGSNK